MGKLPNYVNATNSHFNPNLYSSTGAVTGCPGSPSNVAAVNGNPGYAIYPSKGGSGKVYYGYSKSASLGTNHHLKGSYAPVTRSIHKGGKRKRRLTKKMNRRKRRTRTRTRRRTLHKKKSHRRKSTHKRRRKRRHRGGYSQYLSNVPFSQGYSSPAKLSHSNNALANPIPFKPYNHCRK